MRQSRRATAFHALAALLAILPAASLQPALAQNTAGARPGAGGATAPLAPAAAASADQRDDCTILASSHTKSGSPLTVRCPNPPGGPPGAIVAEPRPTPVPAPVPAPAPSPAPSPAPPASTDPPPATPPAANAGFRYFAPGLLVPQDAGRGRQDREVWLPDMVFPLKLGEGQHAFLNSQIWGYGGGGWNGKGAAGGGECDPRNFDPMAQRDNYCEVRGHSMPLCPAGKGHQGQDIRPPTCADNKWEAVAAADGIVDLVTSNTTVRIKGNDGTQYRYLHMHPDSIRVRVGQRVKAGDVLGRVSRYMNGSIQTTRHLHFDVIQRIVVGSGSPMSVFVPTYTSLIVAYRKAKGLGPGIDTDGNLVPDPDYEIGVAQAPTPPAPQPPAPAPEPPPAPQPPAPAPEPPPAPQPPAPAPEPPPAPQPPAPAPEPPQPAPAPTEPAPPQRTWMEWSRQVVSGWWEWAGGFWKR